MSFHPAVRRTVSISLTIGTALLACFGDPPEVTSPVGGDGGTDGGVAAPGDSSTLDASPGACWPYRPTNYDPCAPHFDEDHPSNVAKVVEGSETLDTDVAADTVADGASTYALFRHAALTVATGATLTIRGSVPALFVVAGDVTIEGAIVVEPSAGPSTCAKLDSGSSSANCTAGAAGGGFGSPGGGGGGGGPSGGMASGNAKLTPLRAGCPGGASGTPNPASNGGAAGASSAAGGLGGGAIEISARGKVTIASGAKLLANGGGGGGGDARAPGDGPNHTSDGKSCDSGGGGGGSGGAILIEGTDITVNGIVCAVGGSGGGGGEENGIRGIAGSASPSCALAPGGGTGSSSTAKAPGGAGAAVDDAARGANSPSCGYTSSGGGGGGSGRIRVRASRSLVSAGTMVPTPTAE